MAQLLKGNSLSLFRRVFAAGVLVCFMATNHFTTPALAALAPTAPKIESIPLELSTIKVPAEIGKIEEVFKGKNQKTVILIQDAHAIPDAQRNIQKLIDHFQKEYAVNITATEGAASELDPQIFRSFPDKNQLKKKMEEYLENGEITGSTAASILNDKEGIYQGIEDWNLYEQGLGFYLVALGKQAALSEKLSSLEKDLQSRKEKAYSKELLEIDKAFQSFRENHKDLIDFLKFLAHFKRPESGTELSILLEEGEGTEEIQAPIELEVKKAAQDIEQHLKLLPVSSNVNKDLASFYQKFQEFQTSRISPQAFALFLKELASKDGLPMRSSQELSSLVKSQKKMRDIEGTRFFKDFEQYVDSVKEKLFRNEVERQLDKEGRTLEILERLIRLELSHEDWKELNEIVRNSNLPIPLDSLKAHFSFYENAGKRDETFFNNLLSLMQRHQSQSTLFIAGGFHTEGLTERLKAQGISYILLMPMMNSIPEHSHYQENMQGKVSWKNYFEVENGKIDLYKAFVRGTRDKLLQEAKDSKLAKYWRDQIIRDLAEHNKIEKAAEYTQFVDEISKSNGQNKQLSEKLGKVDRFIEGLRRLETEGRVNVPNILNLLKPATMTDPYGLLARNLLNARLANGTVNESDILPSYAPSFAATAARSEMRTKKTESKPNTRKQKLATDNEDLKKAVFLARQQAAIQRLWFKKKILPRSHPLSQFVSSQLQRIIRDHKAEIFVIEDDEENAFATGTNQIYVTTGMLKLFDNEEELLALLMHELTHIEEEHPYAHRFLDPFDLYGLGVRRLAEFHADTAMLLELDKRGINPIGAIRFTKKINSIIQKKKTAEKDRYGRLLDDIQSSDPEHGSMALRHVNLRELIRFADLLHLSEEVHPIDWSQYQAETTLPPANLRKQIRGLADFEPRDFWLSFGQLLQAEPQAVWPQKVQEFIDGQGVRLNEKEELIVLLALHGIILRREEPFVYEKNGQKITIPFEEMQRYFEPAIVTKLLERNIFEKLGLWLKPSELLSIAQKSFENSLQNKPLKYYESQADILVKLRNAIEKVYRTRYAEPFDFIIKLDTQLVTTFVLTNAVKRKASYDFSNVTVTIIGRTQEAKQLHILGDIPYEALDEKVLNRFLASTKIGLVSLEDLMKNILDKLDLLKPAFQGTGGQILYDARSETMMTFKNNVSALFNAISKNATPVIQQSGLSSFQALERAFLMTGDLGITTTTEGDMIDEEARLRMRQENFLIFSDIELASELMRSAASLYRKISVKFDNMGPENLNEEITKWFSSLNHDPDQENRFRRIINKISLGFELKFDLEKRREEDEFDEDNYIKTDEMKKMILYELYMSGTNKVRFIRRVNEFIATPNSKFLSNPTVFINWLESIIKERNEKAIGPTWSFGIRERSQLTPLLAKLKRDALEEFEDMKAEKILDAAVALVSEWGIAFVDIGRDSYDAKWKVISRKLNQYLSKNRDFPNTPEDFEKILAISLLSQESFTAMSLAAVSFREMIKRSRTFDEAFNYIKKYSFLPRTLVREALFSLMEEKAKSREELDRLSEWFMGEIERLLQAGGDVLTAELAQTLLTFIEEGERLDFFKHIISTNEDDKGFKNYMAVKWWRVFNSDVLEVSNINDIALLAYYGESGNPAKLEMAKHRSAESLAGIDTTKIKMLFFEEFYSAMFRLDSMLIYLLMRSLTLEGREALFRSEKSKKALIQHFIQHYLKIEKSETANRVIHNVTEALAQDLDPEDLFYFLGPALAQVALQIPENPYPTEEIMDGLLEKQLNSLKSKFPGIEDKTKYPQTQEILRARIKAFVTGVAPSIKTEYTQTQQEGNVGQSKVFFPKRITYVNFENAASERLAPLIGQRKVFSKQVTPIELSVEVSKHVGSLAVRMLQLVGMYFELSQEDRQVLSQVYDAVQGQTKLQAYMVMKREADRNLKFKALFEKIVEIREMVGGGSIVTVYDSIDENQDRWALGVKNPNAGYRSGELAHFGEQILDGLIKRANGQNYPEVQYYRLLKLLLSDAHKWVLDELNDPDYIKKNEVYEKQNDYRSKSPEKFKPTEGVTTKLFIPDIRDTNTDLIRWEKFVEGNSFNSFLTRVKHEGNPHSLQLAQRNVAVITQNYFYQLFETGVVHSDIHPGQFLMMAGEMLGVLDRKNILLFDEEERGLLLEVIADSFLGNHDRAFERLVRKFANSERLQDESFVSRLKVSILQKFDPKSPEKSIGNILWVLKQEGVDIPLKWVLVTKNIMALNKMAQLSGFPNLIQALIYSPDGQGDIMRIFQTITTLLPKSSTRLMALLGQEWLSGKLTTLLGGATPTLPVAAPSEKPSKKKPSTSKKARSELRQISKIFIQQILQGNVPESELIDSAYKVGKVAEIDEVIKDLIALRHEVELDARRTQLPMDPEIIKSEIQAIIDALARIKDEGYTVGYLVSTSPNPAYEEDFAAATAQFPTSKQILINGKVTDHLRRSLSKQGKIPRQIEKINRSLVLPGPGQVYAGVVSPEGVNLIPLSGPSLIPITASHEEKDLDPLVAKYIITLQTAVSVLLAHQAKDENQKRLILLNPAALLKNYNLVPTYENQIIRGTANGLEISTVAVRAYLEWKASQSIKAAA